MQLVMCGTGHGAFVEDLLKGRLQIGGEVGSIGILSAVTGAERLHAFDAVGGLYVGLPFLAIVQLNLGGRHFGAMVVGSMFLGVFFGMLVFFFLLTTGGRQQAYRCRQAYPTDVHGTKVSDRPHRADDLGYPSPAGPPEHITYSMNSLPLPL